MVQQLLKLCLAVLLVVASCTSIHSPGLSKYQQRNLKSFQRAKHFNKFHARKKIKLRRTGSFRHPAVPDFVRKTIRKRQWSKKVGEGKLD
jgi:hypothetical protein